MDWLAIEQMEVGLFSDGVVPIESEVEHLHSLVLSTHEDLSSTYFLDAVDVIIAHGLNLALVVDGVIEDLVYIQVPTTLPHNYMSIIYSAHTCAIVLIC